MHAQGTRLRRRFAWHGLALVVLVASAALALFFALDHTLRLPLPIRLLHTTAVGALLVAGGWRFVRYPLQRPFGNLDVAQVLERSFPELHQRLVSALQLCELDGPALRGQSKAMVGELLSDAQRAIGSLRLEALFDPTRTRRLALGAAGLVALLTLGAWSAPATAHAFVLRHLGVAAEYPRSTYLEIELPPAGPELQREDRADETVLLLSAGADLHVSVLAKGVVPAEVFLDVLPRRDGSEAADDDVVARAIPTTPRPGDRFRHVFRRVAGTFEFRARGGDDERGDRRVVVRTLRPPQVAGIRARIQPPAYVGQDAVEQPSGAIEALVGSEVELTVATTAAVRSATLQFLESGQQVPLTATVLQDDSAAATVYVGRFRVEKSDRYEVRLLAENGLANPNPGNYPVAALTDYAPVGRWLLPDDENLLLLPTALLCVRYEARDDFGLANVQLQIERNGQPVHTAEFVPPAGASEADGASRREAVRTEYLEVGSLLGGAAAGNDGLALLLALADGRQPAANRTELPRRIVQIVDAPQLAAAVARSFRAMREETEQALSLQRDRRAKLEEVLVDAAANASSALTGIEVGQARIGASAQRLHLGLMRSFDLHLWNRLDPSPNAPRAIEVHQRFARDLRTPLAFDPDYYRELLRLRQAGTLGALETTLDPILAMVALADELASHETPGALRLLAQVEQAPGGERRRLLEQALANQQRIEDRLQQLLLRLEEWNDFQDLIQETRALRDRQRDLQARTIEVQRK